MSSRSSFMKCWEHIHENFDGFQQPCRPFTKSINFFSSSHTLRPWSLKKGILFKAMLFSGSLLLLHPKTTHKNKAFCKGRMQSLTIYECFASEWNTEMMSQSKLDPSSFIIVHGPKKHRTSLLWNGITSEIKIQQKFIYAKEIWGASGTLRHNSVILG